MAFYSCACVVSTYMCVRACVRVCAMLKEFSRALAALRGRAMSLKKKEKEML